jgi:hypothetical protein
MTDVAFRERVNLAQQTAGRDMPLLLPQAWGRMRRKQEEEQASTAAAWDRITLLMTIGLLVFVLLVFGVTAACNTSVRRLFQLTSPNRRKPRRPSSSSASSTSSYSRLVGDRDDVDPATLAALRQIRTTDDAPIRAGVWPLRRDEDFSEEALRKVPPGNGTVFLGNWTDKEKEWARDVLKRIEVEAKASKATK